LKNRNKAKSLLAGFLAVLTVLTMLGGTTPTAQAKSSSELKKQLEQLKEEKKEQDAALKELKGQLKDNVNEMEDVVSQKDIIDQEIFYINEQISNIEQQVATYSLLIADKQDELDNARERLQLLNKKNKERIQAMEEEGSLSYWSVLFKANSFSDLLDRLNMIQEIAAADQRRMQELKEAAENVSAARDSLQGEKAELEAAMVELDAATAELDIKRKEADEILEKLIAKGEAYEALIDESEDLQAELMQQIAKTEKDYKNQKYKEWLATSVPPTTKKPSSSNSSSQGAPAPSSSGWRSPLALSSYVTGERVIRLPVPQMKTPLNKAKGILVRWGASTGATGFKVFRKSGKERWQCVATVKGTKTLSWLDKSVQKKNGTHYRYTVRALNGSVLSGYEAQGKLCCRLNAPTLTSVKALKEGKLSAKWKKNGKATGYDLLWKSGKKQEAVVVQGKLGHTFKGLKKGKYQVYVRAWRREGEQMFYSDWSAGKKVKL
jgi:peptidoglycan hydrolase CwlO-like protein